MSGEQINGPDGRQDGTKKPDETQYELMEIAAEAGGSEAEARRQEMAKWSKATGAYAEGAAARQSNVEAQALQDGRSDSRVKADMVNSATVSQREGEPIPGGGSVRPAVDSRASQDKRIDMIERDHFEGIERQYRSPATMRQQQESIVPQHQASSKEVPQKKSWWKRITGK